MLSFEALLVLDAIDRKGSFAAAADFLNRAPSSLSYQVQKFEQDLDIMIFDRSGHKATFTDAGRLLLERGRVLLNASDKIISDARSLAHGWELDITIAFEGLLAAKSLFPLVDRFNQEASTRVRLQEEILAGAWEALEHDRADILISTDSSSIPLGVKTQAIGQSLSYWVAKADHPIHKHKQPFDPAVRRLYRSVAVADSARDAKTHTFNILDNQPRITVTSMNEKYTAILEGYGIGTMPTWWIEDDLKLNNLKIIEGSDVNSLQWVIAWKRKRMGNAKSWFIRHLPNALYLLKNKI